MEYLMKSIKNIPYIVQYGAQLTLLLELVAIAPVKAEIAKNPKYSAFQEQSQRELSLSNEQSNLQISTSAGDLLAQQNTITRITGVEIEQTQKGLQIILKTVAGSQKLVPLILPEGNNLVIDILDATLAFAIRNGVTETSPAPGITEVNLTKVDNSSIRLTIKGEKNAPSAEVVPSQQNLVLSVTPEENTAQQQPDEEIEVIATGEAEENEYIEPNASTATRTDTPQRDIPQAIQVIPQQVIKDQGVTRIEDALRNAVGVNQQVDRRSPAGSYNIRGFESRGLRNGFDFDGSGTGRQTPLQLPNNIERVEVLRGPDSVLNGAGEPGGTVNYVTKQPLTEPFYSLEFTAGQFDFYQPSIDLTGPLTEDKKLLYRFTAAYQSFGSFLDFVEGDAVSIAPTISYDFSDATNLKLEYEYAYYEQVPYSGLRVDPVIFDLPESRNYNFTDDRRRDGENHALILSLNHEFNDNLSVRSGLRANFFNAGDRSINLFDFDPETNEVFFNYKEAEEEVNTYSWQNSLTGKFKTGSVKHQLLFGVDWITENSADNSTDFNELALDVFNPDFDQPFEEEETYFFDREVNTDRVGIYLQDQVTLLSNLKLLVGGRYDIIRQDEEGFEIFDGERTDLPSELEEEAFSPRIGLVYQPIEPVSLYANFNRSFSPNSSTTSEGELLEPERGTQYEIGVKTEFGKMAVNLALYEITKTNVARIDPDDSDFSIAIGEVRSRGIELDLGGEILPGWNITASTFFADPEVTVGDEDSPEGNGLENAPTQGASLWTSYEIQKGGLQGAGFGFGLFYVSDVEAELPNDFVIPSYVRADASLFYRRENWDAQLNFKNLFDKEYFEGTTAGLTSRGAPFTVLGSVSVEF
jgi:iron complex outermembrane recepter protein